MLYNGAGDYLMYEAKGHNKGKLLAYWHDDERRNVEYQSLREWAQQVLQAAMP